MPRMIANPGQILDEQGDARERPEIGLVTLSRGACQQRGRHFLRLLRGQFRFGSCRSLAGQRYFAAFLPCLFPTVSRLPGNAQPAGYLRSRTVLGKQFGRLLAALFHHGMISRLQHAL